MAGPDFGTGSSREHAVWALMNYGFRVVISSRFADIFRGNSGKAGLLTAQADQADVELLWKLLETEPGTEVTVDLRSRTITAKDIVAPFEVDDYIRWRLLEGLDDIGLTLRHEAEITAYEASRPAWKPTVTRWLSRARRRDTAACKIFFRTGRPPVAGAPSCRLPGACSGGSPPPERPERSAAPVDSLARQRFSWTGGRPAASSQVRRVAGRSGPPTAAEGALRALKAVGRQRIRGVLWWTRACAGA